MKKLIILSILLLTFSSISFAENTNPYQINDAAVEGVFKNATVININTEGQMVTNIFNPKGVISSEKSAVTAFVIATFCGVVGIHRWYLGTSTNTKLLYFFTCGALGVLPTVDWLLLLINGLINKKPIDAYVNNPGSIMWKK
ncbi:MAG: NINE protein [Bacteroidetes bacterium]|nr:NINE protein [Bacteroidota bacterium]